jgi:hypothetical protein
VRKPDTIVCQDLTANEEVPYTQRMGFLITWFDKYVLRNGTEVGLQIRD